MAFKTIVLFALVAVSYVAGNPCCAKTTCCTTVPAVPSCGPCGGVGFGSWGGPGIGLGFGNWANNYGLGNFGGCGGYCGGYGAGLGGWGNNLGLGGYGGLGCGLGGGLGAGNWGLGKTTCCTTTPAPVPCGRTTCCTTAPTCGTFWNPQIGSVTPVGFGF